MNTLAIYVNLLQTCHRFERKGKTVPYTSANEHMFSLINKEGDLGIRFSKSIQEKYFEKYQTSYFKSHNAVMRGYIHITEMLMNEEDLVLLLNESYDYVMSLPKKNDLSRVLSKGKFSFKESLHVNKLSKVSNRVCDPF